MHKETSCVSLAAQGLQVSKPDSVSTVIVYRKPPLHLYVDYCKLTSVPLQAGKVGKLSQGNRQHSVYQVNLLSLGLHRLQKTIINHKASVSLLAAKAASYYGAGSRNRKFIIMAVSLA